MRALSNLLLLGCAGAFAIACGGGKILVGDQGDGAAPPSTDTPADSGAGMPSTADGSVSRDAAGSIDASVTGDASAARDGAPGQASSDGGIYSSLCELGQGLCCTLDTAPGSGASAPYSFICDPGGAMCPSPAIPDSKCSTGCLAYTIPVACSLGTVVVECGANPAVCVQFGAGCDTTQAVPVCACPDCQNGALCGGPSCGPKLVCGAGNLGCQPSFGCCPASGGMAGGNQTGPSCTNGVCSCPAGYEEEPIAPTCM